MDHNDVVQAKESFWATEQRMVRAGETFRAGHELVKKHQEMFEPFTVENDLEEATAKPGTKRGK